MQAAVQRRVCPSLFGKRRSIVLLGYTDSLHKVLDGSYIQAVGALADTPVGRNVQTGFPFLSLLRGNHNHTVGTLRTVNCGSRGILQDFNALNIAGIQEIDARPYLDAVYYIQWVGRTVYRSHTTDSDGRSATGVTRVTQYLHAGCRTLQTLTDVDRVTLHQVFRFHRGHRTRKV